jgi:hypothetical protein
VVWPPPRWLAEAVLILVSVALGFAAAEYGQRENDRELAGRAIAELLDEMEYNVSVLEPMVPMHATWVSALADADSARGGEAAVDVLFATRPDLPPGAESPFPFLRRSAWDAAMSGGALRLIDYDVAAALSEVYRMQETATDNVDRLAEGALSQPETYDPASRAASVRLLWLTLLDIQSAEAILLDLYRQNLPIIQGAAGRQP